MLGTAVVGLGWWGKVLIDALQESEVMRVVAATSPTLTDDRRAYAAERGLRLVESYDALLADPAVDVVVLATPPGGHAAQVTAAARAGKHVYCEKPFSYSKAEAETMLAAVEKAGVALAVGFNRRFHPESIALAERIRAGDLGIIEHMECTMAVPSALMLPKTAWRANPAEAPCGALASLGVHAVDAFMAFAGEVDTAYCQSFRRAVDLPTDDTTSVLFRMKNGASAYLGMMMATAPAFAVQVYGSKGWVRLDGAPAGPTSEERRKVLYGTCRFQPVTGEPETWQAARVDTPRACLEALGRAATGGPPFPLSPADIVHGAAVAEAIIRSASSGAVTKVG